MVVKNPITMPDLASAFTAAEEPSGAISPSTSQSGFAGVGDASPGVDKAIIERAAKRVYGDDAYPVWYRRAVPTTTPKARYPGFKPETVQLRAGELRVPGAQPLPCDMFLDRDIAVNLRDGMVIYTDVFRPIAEGKYPVIVAWSPYGKQLGCQMFADLPGGAGVTPDSVSGLNKFEGPDPAFWVNHGYVLLNVDIRGAYRSGGVLGSFGRQTAEDGYDFVEWAAVQNWSNGKVGFSGNSWLAASQYFIAAERPPHLAAIAPWEGFSDLMRDLGSVGGIPMLSFSEFMMNQLSGESLVEDFSRMIVTERDETPYWKDLAAQLERIEVPAYVVASFDNDIHTRGTLDAFRRMSSKQKWLRVHNTWEWPDLYSQKGASELLAFFDHYLKGEDNGWHNTPRIRISVLDPGREDEVNRPVEAWPPKGYPHQQLFLTRNLDLSDKADADPGKISYSIDSGQTIVFRRAIDRESELIGYMKLKLWVEAEGSDDMDLVVSVEKIDVNGVAIPRPVGNGEIKPLRASGAQRASRRSLDASRSTSAEPFLSMQGKQRLKPGEIVPLEIAIWPTGFKIHAGEILQLTLAPYKPEAIHLPMGSARISIPLNRFTYPAGETIEMETFGGDANATPAWLRDQAVWDAPRNFGSHIFHMGGSYDSHLLVPLREV